MEEKEKQAAAPEAPAESAAPEAEVKPGRKKDKKRIQEEIPCSTRDFITKALRR